VESCATRILVTDDEEAICFAFRRYFRQRSCRVEVAATGREGLARFRRLRPDVACIEIRSARSCGNSG